MAPRRTPKTDEQPEPEQAEQEQPEAPEPDPDPPTETEAIESNSRLQFGSTGDLVVNVQRALQHPETGTLDRSTLRSLVRFQRQQGLRPTGVTDDATWAALSDA